MASVDASNSCIPPSYPLVKSVPPLPLTTRGEPLLIDGHAGRLNSEESILLYTSGRLVVVRYLENKDSPVQAFCYRGHTVQVTAAKFSPSGAYVASADQRGKLRVWSYDNEEHLCKLDLTCLAGPVRDIAWDMDSTRICIVGERSDASSECARVIQWDTGVSCGELGQHRRGRAASCAFKPNRPMRIVTGGKDDFTVYLNAGPPFKRTVDSTQTENAHTKGAVNCVRFHPDGTKIASVGSDKSVCVYDGKTMVLECRLENVHAANIYACDWSSSGTFLLTCSADGTVKLLSAQGELSILHTWNVAKEQLSSEVSKVPLGGMQMGCAFVKDDVPVSVGLNGQIAILPSPPVLKNGSNEYTFLTGHTAPIAGLAMSFGNGCMYTGDTDGILCKWNVATGKAITRFPSPDSAEDDLLGKIHTGAISGLAVAGSQVLSAGWDDVIRISDENGVVNSQATISLESQPSGMATGTNVVLVMTVGGLLLLKDGAVVSSLIPVEYAAQSICFSSDDTTVYVGGDDCKIHVYKVNPSQTGLDEVHVIENGHLKPVHALALSNDGSKLASADVRDVCVWSLDNYAPLVSKGRWCFHTQRVTCLSWSPNDEIVASGGADDSIYLWSLEKKTKRVHYAFCHRGGVTGLSFLQEGLTLVSVGADACVNQWDVTDDVTNKFG